MNNLYTLPGRLRDLPSRISRNARRLARSVPFLNGLHAQFVRADHRREVAAVAAGQLRYDQETRSRATSFYLLRRNIHRLEKGLIMRPRRKSFAVDYIRATVDAYCLAQRVEGFDAGELTWAHDVLALYFDTVDDTDPVIAAARQRFQSEAGPCEAGWTAVPFQRDLAVRPVSPEALLALSRRRRSVRWFTEQPVPRELVDAAMEVAAQAPSACNRQPFRFHIYDDATKVREVADVTLGAGGFAHQIPAIAVIVGRLRAYPLSRDRHAIYVDGALAAMSFMLALETHGLASCPINWADQEPQESRIREILALDDDERVVMLVAFGWPDPDGMVPCSAKKGLDELRRYECGKTA